MAYKPYLNDWECLANSLKRVVASGADADQAQVDICGALSDQKIGVRAEIDKSDKWQARRRLRQNEISIPLRLAPADFDWKSSRPTSLWQTGDGSLDFNWELRPIGPIELRTEDVIDVLCGPPGLVPSSGDTGLRLAKGVIGGDVKAFDPPPRAKRGRKIKYDWLAVREQVFTLLNDRGDYEVVKSPTWRTQADLEGALLEFMGENGGEAGVSTLRESDKLPTWIAEWRAIDRQ